MRVNHKRVGRVMHVRHRRAAARRRQVTTVPEPSSTAVPDLLRRDFTAAAPNTKYVGDITYLPVGDGKFLYLATVTDCFSRVWWAGRSSATCAPRWSRTRSQRTRRAVQRGPQTRDAPRRPPLRRGPRLPSGGLPLDHALHHPPPALGERTAGTDRLRTSVGCPDTCRITKRTGAHPSGTIPVVREVARRAGVTSAAA